MRVVDIINVSSSAHTLLKARVLAMRERGIDNRILCIDGPYVERLRAAGIPVHTVPLPRGLHPWPLLVSLARIAAYLRRERIDVVHTHCSVPGAVGRVAAWLAGVPVIVHTVHGFHFTDATQPLKRWLAIEVERVCGWLTDTLLTQNRADLEQAERHGIGPRGRRRRIGNGIDLARFRPSPRPADGAVPTVTCIARFEPVKNHPMLFEAARLLMARGECFRLWLVGTGVLEEEYRETCRRLGIAGHVEFLGYRDDIPEVLAATDVAVLTSIQEGIPRAVLEPMAMGLPVVATWVRGTSEALRPGETGLAVPLGDVPALAEALATLIHDPALRARLGARGREVALEEFDEGPIAEALAVLYHDRLRARSRTPRPVRAEVRDDGLPSHARGDA